MAADVKHPPAQTGGCSFVAAQMPGGGFSESGNLSHFPIPEAGALSLCLQESTCQRKIIGR